MPNSTVHWVATKQKIFSGGWMRRGSRNVAHPAVEEISLGFVLQLLGEPANLEIYSIKIIRPKIVDELKILILV
jgi:hypothetical protein